MRGLIRRIFSYLLLAFCLSTCTLDEPAGDNNRNPPAEGEGEGEDECVTNADCTDDHTYCNGEELCSNHHCVHSGNPCQQPTPNCQEEHSSCTGEGEGECEESSATPLNIPDMQSSSPEIVSHVDGGISITAKVDIMHLKDNGNGTPVTPTPVAVFTRASPNTGYQNLRNFFISIGYAVAVTTYRVAPYGPEEGLYAHSEPEGVNGHTFPEDVQHNACQVAWLRENAAEYNIDPDKMVILGFSGGGHMAAALAYMQGGNGDVDWLDKCPSPDTIQNSDAVLEFFGAYIHAGPVDLVTYSGISEDYMFGLEETDEIKKASPAEYLEATDVDVPNLLIYGDADTTVDADVGESFHAISNAKGIPSQLESAAGFGHEFFNIFKTEDQLDGVDAEKIAEIERLRCVIHNFFISLL
jgi:acetyl esterase/lipase